MYIVYIFTSCISWQAWLLLWFSLDDPRFSCDTNYHSHNVQSCFKINLEKDCCCRLNCYCRLLPIGALPWTSGESAQWTSPPSPHWLWTQGSLSPGGGKEIKILKLAISPPHPANVHGRPEPGHLQDPVVHDHICHNWHILAVFTCSPGPYLPRRSTLRTSVSTFLLVTSTTKRFPQNWCFPKSFTSAAFPLPQIMSKWPAAPCQQSD